jgi:hypothetical protein
LRNGPSANELFLCKFLCNSASLSTPLPLTVTPLHPF